MQLLWVWNLLPWFVIIIFLPLPGSWLAYCLRLLVLGDIGNAQLSLHTFLLLVDHMSRDNLLCFLCLRICYAAILVQAYYFLAFFSLSSADLCLDAAQFKNLKMVIASQLSSTGEDTESNTQQFLASMGSMERNAPSTSAGCKASTSTSAQVLLPEPPLPGIHCYSSKPATKSSCRFFQSTLFVI